MFHQPFTCTAKNPQNDQSCNSSMNNEIINELLDTARANAESICQLSKILSDLQNESNLSKNVLENLVLFTKELVALQNVTAASPLPASCKEIKKRMPTSPSGVYLIASSEKKTQYVYCHMESLCGSHEGWTRLAHIDMTATTEGCPGGLRLYEVNGVRACGRPITDSGSCHSIQYPSHGIRYSEVCGRARGYQYYSTDAVVGRGASNINSHYVDGLSLTRGNPRKHIWTYIAGLKEDNSFGGGTYACPCQTGSKQKNNIPKFIGSDYYCESGNPALPLNFSPILYTADPLWDGKQCNGVESPCCSSSSLPWFHKPLDATTNDYIEVRVCGDQPTSDEDVAIGQLEVFVK